jgi:hypothetical protein
VLNEADRADIRHTIAAVVTMPLMVVGVPLLNTLALRVLWNAFLSPVGHVSALTLDQAFGIFLLIMLIRFIAGDIPKRYVGAAEDSKQEKRDKYWRLLGYLIATPVAFIALGWWLG